MDNILQEIESLWLEASLNQPMPNLILIPQSREYEFIKTVGKTTFITNFISIRNITTFRNMQIIFTDNVDEIKIATIYEPHS